MFYLERAIKWKEINPIDFVLLGIRHQVIPVGKALFERGYTVSYLFGDETPDDAFRFISKARMGAVTVGSAPSLRHQKAVKALMRCKEKKTSIFIPNPYGTSLAGIVDKIIESVESASREVQIINLTSEPKDERDQVRKAISYYKIPHPERAAAWHRRALESIKDGWIDDAIAFCESALRSDPFNEYSIQLRGNLLRLVKSETALLEVVDELIISNKTDEAIRILKFIAARNPASVKSLLKQAQIHLSLNDLDGAVKAYDAILKIDKRNLAALVGLSAVHLLIGNYAFAVDFAKEALRLDRKNVDALVNASGALVNIANPRAALKYADRAIRRAPANHVAWNNKGHALMQLGRLVEAKKCFREALNIEPNYSLALFGIRQLLELGE